MPWDSTQVISKLNPALLKRIKVRNLKEIEFELDRFPLLEQIECTNKAQEVPNGFLLVPFYWVPTAQTRK